MQRDLLVLELLSKLKVQPYCLEITKAGYPSHPLYVTCSVARNLTYELLEI
jgi:hypothetical protein